MNRPVRHISIAFDLPTKPGQPLGAAEARHDAEVDLGLAELRGVGGDDEVAHHRELAAAAEAVAGDRGDDRLAAAHDRLGGAGEIVLDEHVDEALRRHLLDVGAGGEGLLRAGDDDGAHPGRGVHLGRAPSPSSSRSWALSAFSASGRFSRMVATWSSISTISVS